MIFVRNLEDFLRNLGILWEFLERNLEHFLRYLYPGLGGRLFEAGRLLTFSTFKMGAYSRMGARSNEYGASYVLVFSIFLIRSLIIQIEAALKTIDLIGCLGETLVVSKVFDTDTYILMGRVSAFSWEDFRGKFCLNPKFLGDLFHQ